MFEDSYHLSEIIDGDYIEKSGVGQHSFLGWGKIHCDINEVTSMIFIALTGA
jgi:hypothetical protein